MADSRTMEELIPVLGVATTNMTAPHPAEVQLTATKDVVADARSLKNEIKQVSRSALAKTIPQCHAARSSVTTHAPAPSSDTIMADSRTMEELI
eukprot:CAMPEP_0119549476 /NCGR_PEP_ID=MMETSP1352-20130426/3156_1 /TAXON_ID=265584 /ORGANISM="Stauroneis constricta, Strain CCMP1120" /LENGTH=93 /DNA_ID=CAMNT_0007595033 /DNA_START=122 /DNA_END=400 /DNA_ORIENTATION=+